MHNKLLMIKASHAGQIEDTQAAKIPVGDLIPLQGVCKALSTDSADINIGVWESSPGKFVRQVKEREFCHIISGLCTFTPKGGEAIELTAGDAMFLPENSEGEWNIKETVRKTYILFK